MGIEDRDYMSRDLDGKYLEPLATQQVIAEEATSQPRRRPAKAAKPRRSKLYLAILCLIALAIAAGCFGLEKPASGSIQSSPTWDYEVFSFNLEVTHENGYGHAMRFKTGTSQFDGTIQHIEENGWEYVGVIHAAGELQNHFTYVLFRKRQQQSKSVF